jgi:hypothetical protein
MKTRLLPAWLAPACCALLVATGCGNDSGSLGDASVSLDAGKHADASTQLDSSAMGVDASSTTGGSDAGKKADAGGSGEDAGAGTLSPGDFAAALAKAYCATIVPCCPKSTTGCADNLTQQLTDLIARAELHENTFFPERATACLAAIAALDHTQCKPWSVALAPSLAECVATLDGTIAPGGMCTEPAACRLGLANASTPGSFVGCDDFAQTAPQRCRLFTPTTQVGDACEMGFMGTQAKVHTCAGTLTCFSGMCVEAPACDATHTNGACGDGKVCVSASCETPGTKGSDCSSIPCASGYSCSAAHVCQLIPVSPWSLHLGFFSTQYQCPM